MNVEEVINSEELKSVVEDYRGMCFWNFSSDFLPRTREEVVFALDNLENYGTLDAFRRARRIRQWL